MMRMNLDAYYRPSIEFDIAFLAPWLRQEDKNTIKWMTDMSAFDGLHYSWVNSVEYHTIIVNGNIRGMFGIAGTYNEGCPWMLMTDFLTHHPHLNKLFLIESRKWMNDRKLVYKKLFNFVSAEHKDHIRWIEWLGFDLIDLYPEFGPYKKPFIYFEMKDNV